MLLLAIQPKFPLGQIVITTNALRTLLENEIQAGIRRHAQGDWGTVAREDAEQNDLALTNGDRLLSAYGLDTRKFWIITEWDRSVTTVLLPEDY